MKNNNYIKNFVQIILISVFLVIGVSLLTKYNIQRQKFEYNLTYMIFIMSIFFGGIGIILGLNNLNAEFKKKGILKVDKSKLLILGVPSFIVATIYMWGNFGLFNIMPHIYPFLVNNDYIIIVSNIVLGHTIVTSLYKE